MGALGHRLGKTHHKAAHNQGEVFLRAAAPDLLLDMGEGDDVDDHPARPGGEQAGQLQHLVQGLLGGIGRGDKVDHFQLHAPAGHHPGGNGAVQTAGKQAHRPAAHAHRQTAGAGDGGSMDVGGMFPDLHVYREIRIVDVHSNGGKCLRQQPAHGLADLNGGHGIGLVRPAALHLEGGGGGKGGAPDKPWPSRRWPPRSFRRAPPEPRRPRRKSDGRRQRPPPCRTGSPGAPHKWCFDGHKSENRRSA